MSNRIRDLSEYRGCLSMLEEGQVNLGRYVRDVNAEFSLRNKVVDLFFRRESRIPQLLRETTEVYAVCRQVASERSAELGACRRTLTTYSSDMLSKLGQYSKEKIAPAPDMRLLSVLEEKVRSKSLEERVEARKALSETKIGILDWTYNDALHRDRIADTESKVSDVDYLRIIISTLSDAFGFASDRLTREEEYLNATNGSVCSAIESGNLGKQMAVLGERVRQTINGSYHAFEESTLRIRSALKSLEAPGFFNRPKGYKQLNI